MNKEILLKADPAVCVVGETYQIILNMKVPATIYVQVGNKKYYSSNNGVLVSLSKIHKINIPQKELDKEKEYIVVVTKMTERKTYFTIPEETMKIRYDFKPIIKNDNVVIYQIADAHERLDLAYQSFLKFGKEIDLLILNGDISSGFEKTECLCENILLASRITHGNIPCIIVRGNHELRGEYAEQFINYIPSSHNSLYYTFKVGCLSGIVLDCGEDKIDSCEEYGGTVCCHQFRMEETNFLEKALLNYKNNYSMVKEEYKLIICHSPFSYVQCYPFDIEQDVYRKWCNMIKEIYHPDLMLSGHLHKHAISRIGSEYDMLGQPCPVIIGGSIVKDNKEEDFIGTGIILNNNIAEISFNTSKNIILKENINLLREK